MYIKVNPFMQIIDAFSGLVKPDALYNLKKQTIASKLIYSIIIAILSTIMICGFTVLRINTNKAIEQFISGLPGFYYVNEEFYCDASYDTAAGNSYLILDSDQEVWDVNILNNQVYGTKTAGYKSFRTALENEDVIQVLLISKTNMVTYKKYTGQFSELKHSELFGLFGIDTFSKDIILSEYKGFVVKIGLLCSLVIAPMEWVHLFFTALLLSVVALLINATIGNKENFPSLFWISFYIQSALALIHSFLTSLFNLGDFITSCLCFLIYIIVMIRTLKRGDIALKPAVIVNTDDDLDNYLQQPQDNI